MKNWKEVTQYSTATFSLASGVLLVFLLYFGSGDITNGVLGYVAQTLLYAASIFGVTMYWNGKYSESQVQWSNKYDELKSMILNGNTNMASNSSKNAR